MTVPSMNSIADRFTWQGVGSSFLYTNEAHPGENSPHLISNRIRGAEFRRTA